MMRRYVVAVFGLVVCGVALAVDWADVVGEKITLMMASSLNVAQAKEPEKKKPAYEIPTFESKKGETKEQPKGELTLSPAPNARELFQMVLECWPAKSLFRGELNLETRITQRSVDSVNSAQTTFDPVSGQYVTQSGTGDKFVGLVFRIPLFSAIELDREREREVARRTTVAATVGEFINALAEFEIANREIRLMKALEKRSQERVNLGVAETSEQIGFLEKVAALDRSMYANKAKLIKTRIVLGGMCADDKAWIIDEYLKRFKDIE